MKSLALAILLVSCACQASGARVAESAKALVESGRRGTQEILETARVNTLESATNIMNDVQSSNAAIRNVLTWCRSGVDGIADCCCATADRAHELANGGLQRAGDAVRECPYPACPTIGALGLGLAQVGNGAARGLVVGGVRLAQKGTDLGLTGVEFAADGVHDITLLGLGVGHVVADYGIRLSSKLVDKAAAGSIYTIDTIDNALGGQPERVEEGDAHLHVV